MVPVDSPGSEEDKKPAAKDLTASPAPNAPNTNASQMNVGSRPTQKQQQQPWTGSFTAFGDHFGTSQSSELQVSTSPGTSARFGQDTWGQTNEHRPVSGVATTAAASSDRINTDSCAHDFFLQTPERSSQDPDEGIAQLMANQRQDELEAARAEEVDDAEEAGLGVFSAPEVLYSFPAAAAAQQHQQQWEGDTSELGERAESETPTAPPSSKKQGSSKRKSPRHREQPNGEGEPVSSPSRETGFSPTEAELSAAPNQRQRSAITNWYERLNDLCLYRKQHGHTNVPQLYEANRKLGVWVNKQRMEYKQYLAKEKSAMTEQKIELLRSIDFQWAKRKGQAAWEEKYQELRIYLQTHGNCDVPTKHSENRALGRWVSTQRSMYKNYHSQTLRSNLSSDDVETRIERLNELDFTWNMANSNSDSSVSSP